MEEKRQENNFTNAFASRLNFWLWYNGMTQKALADKMNVGTSTVSNWCKGLKTPRGNKIDLLCEALGCDREDLFTEPKDKKDVKTVSIPVFSYVSAGTGMLADENVDHYIAIPSTLKRRDEYFGLIVRGDSMNPDIRDGDTVIVKKQNIAEDGDIVIALVNGDEGYCKQFVPFKGGISLVSSNPIYKPMIFSSEDIEQVPVQILGVVKQLIREL